MWHIEKNIPDHFLIIALQHNENYNCLLFYEINRWNQPVFDVQAVFRTSPLSVPSHTTVLTIKTLQMKQELLQYHHRHAAFSMLLLICHGLRRHTVAKIAAKTWPLTPATPLGAISKSKATAKGSERADLLWQFLCSHHLGGDKRPPSQSQPATAQTNY